jgi:hypothetical protein
MVKSRRIAGRIGSGSRAARDETVMHLLVNGWSVGEIAGVTGLYQSHVRRIRWEMCRKAESHGELARLKLWRQKTRAA